MVCRDREEKLELYAAGDLPDGEQVAMVTHLAECPECRGRVEEYAAVNRALRRLADAPIPMSDLDEVLRRSTGNVHQERRSHGSSIAWAASAVALISAGFVALMSDRPENANRVAAIRETSEAVARPADAIVLTDVPVNEGNPAMDVRRPTKPDRVIAKLLTRDPKITIILLASDNGGD